MFEKTDRKPRAEKDLVTDQRHYNVDAFQKHFSSRLELSIKIQNIWETFIQNRRL